MPIIQYPLQFVLGGFVYLFVAAAAANSVCGLCLPTHHWPNLNMHIHNHAQKQCVIGLSTCLYIKMTACVPTI